MPRSGESWVPYCGTAPLPQDWLSRWNWDPWLIAALALAVALIAGAGQRLSAGQRRAGFGAIAAMAVLYVSPFCAMGSALFSVRVLHHVLLGILVAPLLAIAMAPLLGRIRIGVTAATILQTVLFWLWHAPGAYAWALSSDAGYWLMQLTILGSAMLFFGVLLRAPAPIAIGALLAAMVQMGLLGALLTFLPHALYAPHYLSAGPWGMTPLGDQQLAGLIMWVPGSFSYLAAALWLARRLLREGQGRPQAPALG